MEIIFIIYDTRQLFIIFSYILGTIHSNLKLFVRHFKNIQQVTLFHRNDVTSVCQLCTLYSLQMMIILFVYLYCTIDAIQASFLLSITFKIMRCSPIKYRG